MISKTIVIGWTFYVGWSFIEAVAHMPPEMSDEVAGIGLMLSMIWHAVLWSIVAIPTFIISMMFRRSPRTSRFPSL